MQANSSVRQADPVINVRLIPPLAVVLLVAAKGGVPLLVIGKEGAGGRPVLAVVIARYDVGLEDHVVVLIDPKVLLRQVHFHIVAAKAVVVVGVRGFCPPIDRLSLCLFVVVQLPPQLLCLVCLVDPVAVIALAGEHDLIAAVGRKGVLLVDGIYLVGKVLHKRCQAFLPDVVVSVIVALVVHFQPVLEFRAVQHSGIAARQIIYDARAGQIVELLDVLYEPLVLLADLGRQIGPLCIFQMQRLLLYENCLSHSRVRSLLVQRCSVHLRRHEELAVLIVHKRVPGRDHVGALHLRHRMEDRQQLLRREFLLFRYLIAGVLV